MQSECTCSETEPMESQQYNCSLNLFKFHYITTRYSIFNWDLKKCLVLKLKSNLKSGFRLFSVLCKTNFCCSCVSLDVQYGWVIAYGLQCIVVLLSIKNCLFAITISLVDDVVLFAPDSQFMCGLTASIAEGVRLRKNLF